MLLSLQKMVAGSIQNRPIRGFLLDITGVLYNSSHGTDGCAIAGSIETVKRLYRESHVRFLSNESTHTTDYVVAKLRRLGFELDAKDVITPAPVAADYVRKNGLRPHTLVYHGIDSYFKDFDSSNANCVVMGDAEEEFTYEAMNAAFRALMKMDDPLLISLGNNGFYQRVDGPCIDVGAYAAALRYATNCRQIVIGKPSAEYFQAGLDSLNMNKDEVLMIGDDISSDVGGAMTFGLRAAQVRTGKWRPEWENHPTVKPTFIADSLKHAVDLLLESNNQ